MFFDFVPAAQTKATLSLPGITNDYVIHAHIISCITFVVKIYYEKFLTDIVIKNVTEVSNDLIHELYQIGSPSLSLMVVILRLQQRVYEKKNIN